MQLLTLDTQNNRWR